MSRDRSVYVCTCTRCGAEQKSDEKEFACTGCGVQIRLVWPAEDYQGKKSK